MKLTPKNPPRRYSVGKKGAVEVSDCGTVHLRADEQVTFITDEGAEYDVMRKDWGFYATPSLNGRLPQFGLRGALVRNTASGRYFVCLVEKESAFLAYLAREGLETVIWLDDEEKLNALGYTKLQ